MWATSWTGIIGLLISHGHYTIDVIIGYYATTRMFWIYHALANRAENKVNTEILLQELHFSLLLACLNDRPIPMMMIGTNPSTKNVSC